MRKIIALALGLVLAAGTINAEEFTRWNGIDRATVEQHIDIANMDVYVYAHHSAERKNDHQVKKQEEAFDELGPTLQKLLKGSFSRTNFIVIKSLEEAPAGATIIDANLTDIDWGSGALRQVVGFGAGAISATYDVTITNAKGLVCQFHNRRFHDTTFSSAKGAAVIKVYNKAIANDLIEALKALK